MSNPSDNPQNPYLSFIVPASAGSGKTYQLSRRFLALVAAHVPPGHILTVTFTKKAAGEMRARILETAATLVANPETQAAFDADMRAFHATSGAGTAPPLPARDVGRAILASSQLLKISTIDSLFLEWVSKFPFEAEPAQPAPAEEPRKEGTREEASSVRDHVPFPSPFQLADRVDSRSFTDLAWRAVCHILTTGVERGDSPANPAVAALLACMPDRDLERMKRRLKALEREDTFLWHGEETWGEGQGFMEIPLTGAMGDVAALSPAQLISQLASPLTAIAAKLSNADKKAAVMEAIGERCLDRLLAAGLIAKSTGHISGGVIKGKTREALSGEIATVDRILGFYLDGQKIAHLNKEGRAYYHLYQAYRKARDIYKYQAHKLEFIDLVKGAYRLLHGDAAAGVRFLLSRTIQHVLLDEFQDTSRLQWAIFSEMALTLLSAGSSETGPAARPSVFIVGDAKQSIYGFREADPAVMADAKVLLRDYTRIRPIFQSYRTAQVVLDFVNQVFGSQGLIKEFPTHSTASRGSQSAVTNLGRVMLGPLFGGSDDLSAAEQEAEYLAATLEAALSGVLPCPIPGPAQGEGASPGRALRPGDCAILYRSTTHASLYEKALRRRGIPCQREEERGFFARPEVADTIALLTFLNAPSDTQALATVLRSPLIRLPDALLIDLLARSLEGTEPSPDSTVDGGKPAPLAAHDQERPSAHDENRSARLLRLLKASAPTVGAVLEDLMGKADRLMPHALLLDGLNQLDGFGVWSQLLTHQPGEAAVATANLLRLVEICLSLEAAGHSTLGAVLRRLSILADDDEVGNASAAAQAVTLMTIHKSKGLEFPFVAVVDTGRPFGQQDPYWSHQYDPDTGRTGMSYIGVKNEQPQNYPLFDHLVAETVGSIRDESLRVLYVALTRAKHYLLLTGHSADSRKGLMETAPYAVLEKAMTEELPSSTSHVSYESPDKRQVQEFEVAGVIGRQWCVGLRDRIDTGYGELGLETEPLSPSLGHSPLASPKVPRDPDGLFDHLLQREWRLRSPSRHDDPLQDQAADGQVPGLTVKPWSIPALATAFGTLIHLGLEHHLQGRPFDGTKAWQSLAPLRYRDARYATEALAELAHGVTDPLWPQLWATADRVETELPLVLRPHSSATLLTGTLDALFAMQDGSLLIIDHKTTRFLEEPSQIQDSMLLAFVRQRRWHDQLRDYAAAVSELYPGRPITQAIYFHALRRLVRL